MTQLTFKKPDWTLRRIAIFGTLVLCSTLLVYLAGWGEDTRLNETLAWGSFGTMVFVISGYVFGSVIEDVSLFRKG